MKDLLARIFGLSSKPAKPKARAGRREPAVGKPRSDGGSVRAAPMPAPVTSRGAPGERIVFEGDVLTAQGARLGCVPENTRRVCVLFSTGVLLVSDAHKTSPLIGAVQSEAALCRVHVTEIRYVSPEVITQAYAYAAKRARQAGSGDESVYRVLVERVLRVASERHASDVHLTVADGRTLIQIGADNELHEFERWTVDEGRRVVGVIFNNAQLATGSSVDELKPQECMLAPSSKDGAIALPEGVTGVRFQSMPLVGSGERNVYLVLRLHYAGERLLGNDGMDLEVLGYSSEQVATLRRSWRRPGGARIFAAPTNQGKTTSLRMILNNRLREVDYRLNCLMIEDPPEGGVRGARQIGVSAGTEEERSRVLGDVMRALLRVAPDILLMGEIRDFETAHFVFRLALTGRQVYTTVHVYNAIAIPQRLQDLGLDPFLVFDHRLLSLLVSQRLVRRLCTECRRRLLDVAPTDRDAMDLAKRVVVALARMDAERKEAAAFGAAGGTAQEMTMPDLNRVMVSGPGCEVNGCRAGRTGRTIVAEVVEPDETLMRYLRNGEMGPATHHWTSALGGIPMHWHALEKIRRGEISPKDVEDELGPLVEEREMKEFAARYPMITRDFDRLFRREAAE